MTRRSHARRSSPSRWVTTACLRAQQRDVMDHLMELTQAAVARGAFGSPTFFVGGDMFFGKGQLRDVEEAIEFSRAPM